MGLLYVYSDIEGKLILYSVVQQCKQYFMVFYEYLCSERSLNPISQPRHTHLSLIIYLTLSMELDPFSVPGYRNWWTVFVLPTIPSEDLELVFFFFFSFFFFFFWGGGGGESGNGNTCKILGF